MWVWKKRRSEKKDRFDTRSDGDSLDSLLLINFARISLNVPGRALAETDEGFREESLIESCFARYLARFPPLVNCAMYERMIEIPIVFRLRKE